LTSFRTATHLFGENAFRRFTVGTHKSHDGKWESKFNASLYDAMMGVFCTFATSKDKNQFYAASDAIREGIIDLMVTNQDFIDAILLGTSGMPQVKARFSLLHSLSDDILRDHSPQPRAFTKEMKQGLFLKNPTCALCGQGIEHLDDASVDHIRQYWRGGKTIPENARLTHRYCNNARPRHL